MRNTLEVFYGTWFSDRAGIAPLTRERLRRSVSRSEITTTSQHALLKQRPHIWVPPTPYEMTSDVLSQFNTYIKRSSYPPAGGTGVDGTLYGTCDFVAEANMAELKNRAVIKALLNLKAMKVNYAQAWAERRQTASLVVDSATKIGRALRRIRKGDVKGAARALGVSSARKGFNAKNADAIAENWLAIQYGWRPLLQDVAGSMENLYDKDHMDKDRYRITVRGTSTGDNTTKQVSYSSTYYKGYATQKKVRSARVRLDYYLENPALAQASGLGLINPMELAWELLPYSFVADWFIPIGDYLSAMDADLGFLFRGGCCTTLQVDQEYGITLSLDKTGSAASSFKAFSAGGAFRNQKRIKRTVYASSPIPRLPGFKNPLSLEHVGNAIALLWSSAHNKLKVK